MLALSRKPHESVRIGRDIVVTVVEIRGGEVRLAFDAPPDVPILRTELAVHGKGTPRRRGSEG